MDLISVLVTGAGGGVGQGVIKSLKMVGDLNIRVIGADMNAHAAGLYACDRAYLVEPCHSASYMASLERIFQQNTVDYYIPGTDVELAFCAARRQEIFDRFGVNVVVCPLETVAIANDKFQTSAFLQQSGFSFAQTQWLAQALKKSDLSFPVIVKPAVGCRSIGVEIAHDWHGLRAYGGDADKCIVQELIGDASSEFTCTIVGVSGRLSPVLALRRELRSGDTYRAVPEKSAVIEDYVAAVAAEIGIEGACNFQLRVDRHGIPKIFEINSRYSGTTPFCAQLGFNPVEHYIKLDRGMPYQPEIRYDQVVLRYWSEVVVRKDDMAKLENLGHARAEVAEQFSLFGGAAQKPRH